jgi:hypothetical protein
MGGSIPTPRSVDPTVPERLERICMKALAFDPAERYSTAAELQADLDAYIASLGLTPTRRALGEAVAQAFADDRARLKQVIEEQLRNAAVLTTGESPAVMVAPASIRSSPSGLSANAPSAPSRVSPAMRSSFPPSDGSIRGIPTLVEEQGGGSSGGRTGAGAVRSIAPASTSAARSRAWILGVVVAALAVLTVAGLVVKAQLAGARATSGSAASTAAPSEATASSASIAVGSTSTLATPRTARLTLRGVPAGATVSLDGTPAALAADGTIERPAGETHRLKVEAAGFVTDERSITFDADRAVDVRMARGRAGAGPSTRPTPSARAGTPRPTDPSDVLGY